MKSGLHFGSNNRKELLSLLATAAGLNAGSLFLAQLSIKGGLCFSHDERPWE